MPRRAVAFTLLFAASLLIVASGAQAQRPSSEPETLLLEAPTPAADEATPTPAPASTEVVARPVATYDSASGVWVPSCNDTSNEWLPELEIPAGMIDCSCDGQIPGARCRLWRSFVKPNADGVDPKCVQCVKEPCIDYVTVEEEHRVVIFRCFESNETFKHEGCEGGHWYEAKGTTKLRKLHPCEARVPVKYQKPVIRYRDVYYYIQCDK